MPNPFNDISAAILAGGLGTRLRSVVADRPKVLAPVNGRPFLAYLLDQLESIGIPETVLLVGFGADRLAAEFGDRHGNMPLEYSTEREQLGTAGAVRLALPLFRGETVLLMNGDSYCDLDFGEFLNFHQEHRGIASLAMAHVKNASRFGRITLGTSDRLERFEEKTPIPSSGWINAGIYLFRRDSLEEIATERLVSMERDFLPRLVGAQQVHGFRSDGRFIDIGIPESYAQAESVITPGAPTDFGTFGERGGVSPLIIR